MVSKVLCVSHVFTPKTQAQVLYYVAKKVSICIYSGDGKIQVTSEKVDCDGDMVTCVQEWITVMNVLNSVSKCGKKCILKVLEKFSGKLLLMINVVLSIKCDDIIFTLLMMIFDILQFGYTYDVHTYVNRNGAIESLLCYSKLYGFEQNIFDIPKSLVNYFDETHQIHDHEKERMKARDICRDIPGIDFESKLFLVGISNTDKMIVVGSVKDGVIVRVIYFVNISLQILDNNKEHIDSQLNIFCVEGTEMYEIVKRELKVESVNIRSHHNIIDGKLC